MRIILSILLILSGGWGQCDNLGDLNYDENINILDIVIIANIVLEGNYNEIADIDTSGTLDILDIVALINLILGDRLLTWPIDCIPGNDCDLGHAHSARSDCDLAMTQLRMMSMNDTL